MNKTILTTAGLALLASTFVAESAGAMPIATGTYQLHNHPDGNAAPPLYGLRLDGLLGAGTRVTFDFDATDFGAAMFLDYDGSSLHIYGTAWGGIDGGSTYTDPTLWTIDYWITDNLTTLNDGGGFDDLLVTDDSPANGGTISSALGAWNLTDYTGSHDYSFRLGDENGGGHRGYDGISGWGWVNHSPVGYDGPVSHVAASDWLFTMEAVTVSEPGIVWLFLTGFAALGIARRRAAARA